MLARLMDRILVEPGRPNGRHWRESLSLLDVKRELYY